MDASVQMHSPDWIELLCRVWSEGRSPALKSVIKADRLIPEGPPMERTLAALLVGNDEILRAERDTLRTCWINACEDSDAEISSNARRSLRQVSDPAFLFAYEELASFDQLEDPWPVLRAFYQNTEIKIKARLREVAVCHQRLDWVEEMTLQFDPATIARMSIDELKSVMLIALHHRRRADLARIVMHMSSSLPTRFWDGLIDSVSGDSASSVVLWELAQVCPARYSIRCLHRLKESRLKESPDDYAELNAFGSILESLPSGAIVEPRLRPVDREQYQKSNPDAFTSPWKTFSGTETFELVTDGNKFRVSRNSDSWKIKCFAGRFQGFLLTFGLLGRSNSIVTFDGLAVSIQASTKLPPSSLLADLLAGQLPHSVQIGDLKRLAEIRASFVSPDDRNYATFVLEIILWSQRQQRVALSGAVTVASGRFTIVGSDDQEIGQDDQENRLQRQSHG